MKAPSNSFRSIFHIVFLIFILLISTRCDDDTVIDPPTDLDNPFVTSIAVGFFDVAPPGNENVNDVTVTLIDPRGMLRTPIGDQITTIDLEAGVMVLGLLEDAVFSSQNPYTFSIKAEAPNYADNFQTFFISNERPSYVQVYMNQLDSPPDGISTAVTAVPISGSFTTEPVNVTFDVPGGGNVQLNIPGQTQLFINGQTANVNQATLNISYGDPLSESANRVFPNGPVVANARDSLGERISPTFYFQSLGWIAIDIESEMGEIDSFSQPIQLSLPINSSLNDPSTGRPYLPGTEVPVWSLNEEDGFWEEEYSVFLEDVGGGTLVAFLSLNHLSPWNLDFKGTICTSSLTFEVVNQGCPGMLSTELIATGAGAPALPFGGVRSIQYDAGLNMIEILNVPEIVAAGQDLTYTIFDNLHPATTTSLASVNLNNCTPSPSTVNIVPTVTPNCEMASIRVLFNGNQEPCNNGLWYKRVDNTYNFASPIDGDETGGWNLAGFFDGSGLCQTAAIQIPSPDPATPHYRCMIWLGSRPSGTIPSGGAGPAVYFTLRGNVLNQSVATYCVPVAAPAAQENQTNVAALVLNNLERYCYDNSPNSGTQNCSNGAMINCDAAPSNVSAVRGIFVEIDGTTTPPLCGS